MTTTDEIRNCFVQTSVWIPKVSFKDYGNFFDRWLAEYTRQQREEAWNEAHLCEYISDEYHEKYCGNPYRPETPPFNIHKRGEES